MPRPPREPSAYLHLEFSAAAGVRCEVYERPGLWLSGQDQDKLVEDMRRIAQDAVAPPAAGVLSGRKRLLDQAVLVLQYEDATEQPLGFQALSWLDDTDAAPALHLGPACVRSDQLGRGLEWVFAGIVPLLLAARDNRPLWLTQITQAPAAFGQFCLTYSDVFPSTDAGSRRTLAHQVIAESLLGHDRETLNLAPDAGLDPDRFVVPRAHRPGGGFAESAKHAASHYNDLLQLELDYSRGDDMLQIGRLDAAAARRILRRLPARALWRLPFKLLALRTRARLRPWLAWFNPTQPLGELRPWK